MGIATRIRSWITGQPAPEPAPEKRSLTVESVWGKEWADMMRADVTAGEVVTADTALTLAAVWNAAHLIATVGVGTVPLKVYRNSDTGPQEAKDHPLYALLATSPNPMMTSAVFRRTLQYHILFWGNGYAEIEYNRRGDPIALWPMLPDRTEPFITQVNGQSQLKYRYTSGHRQVVLDATEVFHVPGLGFDGLKGYSVIHTARQSLGLSLAAEKFGASFFGNGAYPGIILKHPGVLEDNGAKLRETFYGTHQGASRANRVFVAEEGMTVEKMTIEPNDAQFLETRRFTVEEVARWFNVPPNKLKDMGRATWSNVEQMNIEFVTESLRPWYVLWEQECDRKLISLRQTGQLYTRFVPEGLLRGDIQTRYTAYSVGRQWGWLSVNDIRKKEDMSTLPPEIGDVYLAPVNMVDAKNLSKMQPAGATPPPDGASSQASAPPWPTPTPALIAAVRDLALTDLQKVVRIEATEARKHAAKSGKVSAWMQEFYTPTYEARMVQTLTPIARAVAAVLGRAPADAAAVVRSLVSSSTSALLELPGVGTEAAVRSLADKWEANRPKEILEMLEVSE